MPPLEKFFDNMMEDLVRPRAESLKDAAAAAEEPSAMDVDEEPVVAQLLPLCKTRTVGEEEWSSFVDLFKQHSIKRTVTFPSMVSLLTVSQRTSDRRHHGRKLVTVLPKAMDIRRSYLSSLRLANLLLHLQLRPLYHLHP